MKIALIQLNYHVGNIEANVAKIKTGIRQAKTQGVDLAVFAELAICGYPPKDLVLQNGFVEKCENAAVEIARECDGIAAIVGGPSRNLSKRGRLVLNSAFFLEDGKVKAKINKSLRPFYDVFDEYRYFEPGADNKLISFKENKLAITVCEDIWNQYPDETGHYFHQRFPLQEMGVDKADCIINISASPFSYMHRYERDRVACGVAAHYKTPLVYVNNIGANTDLIFDGGSFIVDKEGSIVAQSVFFEEASLIFELDKKEIKASQKNGSGKNNTKKSPTVWYCAPQGDYDTIITESVYEALVLGIRDYFNKTGAKKAVLGVSGGIDSALVLVLAQKALGKENVMAVVLPSKFSSTETMNDAMQLLKNTDCPYHLLSIEPGVKAVNESLSEAFKGLAADVTEENIQARMRGLLIMAVSNKMGALMLNTSNKSELSTGYGTLYGDMGGALSVIGDLYKTQIYRLAEYVNEVSPGLIPGNILTKAPTAELKPNQKDTDTLPEFEILDNILCQYIEQHKSSDEIKVNGADEALIKKVVNMVNKTEFKRQQFCPILRVSPKAFGIGRRMPVAGKYEL